MADNRCDSGIDTAIKYNVGCKKKATFIVALIIYIASEIKPFVMNIDDFEKKLKEIPADQDLTFSVLMNTLIHQQALMNSILGIQKKILDKIYDVDDAFDTDKFIKETIQSNIAKYQAEMISKLYPKD